MSINVRGLNNIHKRTSLFHYLNENKIDITFIQETYITSDKYHLIKNEWEGNSQYSPSRSNHSCGVITLFRKDLTLEIGNIHHDINGRKLLINAAIEKYKLTVVNIYAPNNINVRTDFFKNTSTWINKHRAINSEIIMGGDFNCALNVKDRESEKTEKSSKHLHNLLKYNQLIDVLNNTPITKDKFTFTDPATQLGSRLDYIFCSKPILPLFSHLSTSKIPMIPDHKAVICKLKMKMHKGRGYWKMNIVYLDDKVYCDQITNIYTTTFKDLAKYDRRTAWDIFKNRVKEHSIRYGITQTRQKKSRLNVLEKLINSDSPENNANLQEEYDRLYLERARGAQIRSRAKWVEEGEKNSKYFLGLEKKHQTNNSIHQLIDDSGELKDESEDILKTSKSFYQNLYTNNFDIKHDHINNYLSSCTNTSLTTEQAESCDGQITITECETAIGKMKINKSPGLDGLPIEFYSKFWSILKVTLLEVFNESFEQGELSTSQKRSVISLMFKKGDRRLLKNYRPLSLTNVDYRILAFILADRLQNVIHQIIGPHQTAYIKKRFIGENVRLISDIIEYATKFNKQGILLFLDYAKAFDNLNWDFMYASLKQYGFGSSFISWIHVLYNKPEACIKANGWLTDFITIMKGIRQGCPISAMLFIMCAEFLSLQIENNNQICGFPLPNGTAVKLSQYADDSTIILGNMQSIKPTIDAINEFCNVSGLQLNLDKTEGMLIGTLKDNIPPEFGFNWTKGPIRYLGVYLSASMDQLKPLNWENKIDKIQRLLDNWRRRNLTIWGRIQVLKSLALCTIINSVVMLYTPPEILKNIIKMCFKFIWPKAEHIKRSTMLRPIAEGGANMINIELQFKALKSAWIPRILAAESSPWTVLPNHYLNTFGSKRYILSTNISDFRMMPELNKIPEFYKQVIMSYNSGKHSTTPTSMDMLLKENIWCNTAFTIKTKHSNSQVLYDKTWINSNITTLDSIIDRSFKPNRQVWNTLTNKGSYFATMSKILSSVKMYKHLPLHNINDTPQKPYDPKQLFYNTGGTWISLHNQKSKFFYHSMYNKITYNNPLSQTKWSKTFEREISQQSWNHTYSSRIQLIKDSYIKEFNFKYLHLIIPCGMNLYKWGIKQNDKCIYCDELHSIDHLLYTCADTKIMWDKIAVILNIDTSKFNILLGNAYNSQDTIYIISLILHSTYRRFIKDSNDDKKSDLNLKIKYDLKYKLNILKLLPSYTTICAIIEKVVTHI